MQSTRKLLAIAAAFATSTVAQIAVCDRQDAPNWPDCEELMSIAGWDGDITPIEGCNLDGQCTSWANKACQVGWCFTTNDCVAVSYSEFPTAYKLVEQWCKPDDLGGYHPHPIGRFDVILNRSARKRDEGVVETHHSLDEYREIFGLNDTESVDKRQDVTYTNYLVQKGVAKPGEKYQASQEMDSGVEQTWSESTSVSVSVSVTAGVSASFFDIFSASMEITTTYEETHTITKQLTFTSGDCPGAAIVYWEPLFDKYTGAFSDNPDTTTEIWVSREFDGEAEGRFYTDCIGSG